VFVKAVAVQPTFADICSLTHGALLMQCREKLEAMRWNFAQRMNWLEVGVTQKGATDDRHAWRLFSSKFSQ
jgi:hypothetical protein